MCIKCFNALPKFFYGNFEYITWQDDRFSTVGFSAVPDISDKKINKNVMSKDEIKRAKKKPLILKNNIGVFLFDKKKDKKYTFNILSGYDYDGASIPRVFWRLCGSKESIEFKVASLIHDVLCENHHYVDYDRYFATKVFERLLEVGDVGGLKRWVMFHCVDNFQKFCSWKEKEAEENE